MLVSAAPSHRVTDRSDKVHRESSQDGDMDEFMLSLSDKARKCLIDGGWTNEESVREVFLVDDGLTLLKTPNLGRRVLDEIRVALWPQSGPVDRTRGDRGLARSEVIGIRFDPVLKGRLEKAAASERRSISNFIEWGMELVVEAVESKAKKSSSGCSS